MEEALRNLDIELEKVAQKRILEDSQTKMEEDYSEEDTSMQYDGYEDDNGRRLNNVSCKRCKCFIRSNKSYSEPLHLFGSSVMRHQVRNAKNLM